MSITKNSMPIAATTMRTVLIVVLALLLAGISVGFYFAYSSLQKIASETASIQSTAAASDTKVQELITTQAQLEKHASTVAKARQIVAESQSYQYQDQIITDLNIYAEKAGLSIASFTFAGDNDTSAPAAAQTGGSAAGNTGLKSVMVTVELRGNVTYYSTLHFVHLIEQNLTRMQVSGLSLSGDDSAGSKTLQIEVYVR